MMKNAKNDYKSGAIVFTGGTTAKPAHIVTPSATARRILNMTALATVEAGQQ